MSHKRYFLVLCTVSCLLWLFALFGQGSASGEKTVIISDTTVNELVNNPVRDDRGSKKNKCEKSRSVKDPCRETAAGQSVKKAPESVSEDECVNVNKADLKALRSLPGIGKVISERIFKYREKNGKFEAPEQLMEVKGIGPATLEKISSMICL